MFGPRKSMSLFLFFVTFVFLMSSLFLPLCFADGAEPPPAEEEEEKTVFEQLRESLDEYLMLMGEGEVEEALEVLAEYVSALKELVEDPSGLTEIEDHAAHVLYVTSKHLVILTRVYEKAPESAKDGILNALVKSTNGHGNAYKQKDKAEDEEADEGEEDDDDMETSGNDDKGSRGQDKRDKGNGGKKGKKSE